MTEPSFVLMVSRAPYDYRNAENALRFCKAALNLGKNIKQIFFYQSGVLNASFLQTPNSDEVNLYKSWCDLSTTYSIPLNVCISASARRGIVDDQFDNQSESFNVKAPFQIVGMSEFFADLNKHDICIQL